MVSSVLILLAVPTQFIHFNKIKPRFLSNISNSQVWSRSISFESGKSYLITAPSGTGKSTFLNVFYGAIRDYEGEVELYNSTWGQMSAEQKEQIRLRHLSYVYQDLQLFEELSGIENIKLTSDMDWVQVANWAKVLHADAFWKQPCQELSQGQKQRIAILRSLARPFDFLLLDEPFSHLDEELCQKALEVVVQECRKRNAAMILCSLGSDYGYSYDQKIQL